MKKCFYLMAVLPVMMISLVSCSSDDDEEKSNDTSLVGTWVEDTNRVYEVLHKQFNADGSGYHWATDNGEIDSWGKTPISWRASGNSLYIIFSGEDEEKYTYKINGDKLTTTFEGETIVYKRQ